VLPHTQRNLELASQQSGVPINLSWEPFLLNPRMEPEGEDLKEHLTNKYGAAAVRNFDSQSSPMVRAGQAVGINFKMDRNIYPTVQAHSVIEYVKEELGDVTKSNQIMEELYKRYFEQGQNINSVPVLQDVCRQFGITDQEKVQQVAEDSSRHEKVFAKDRKAKNQMNIHGVPFYIIEQHDGSTPVGFSGAQPPDFIAEYLQEAAGN